MRCRQSLPVAAYHPSDEKYFLRSRLTNTRVLEIEQLLRAAIVIGGKENDLEYCKQVMDEKERQEKQAIDNIELASQDGTSIADKQEIDEVNRLITDVEQQKERLNEEISERYNELLGNTEQQRTKAVNLSERNVENSGAGQTAIKTIEIVDFPITEIRGKTFSIVIEKRRSELQQIEQHISEHGGEISSVEFTDDTVKDNRGDVANNSDVIVKGTSEIGVHGVDETATPVVTISELDAVFEYKTKREDENVVPIRKEDTDGIDVENVGYELPLRTVALVTDSALDSPISESKSPTGENVYPFIPWCGVTICTCKRKHGLNTGVEHLCSHEIYVLHKISAESEPLTDESVPERFKRFVYSAAYKKTSDILQDGASISSE
jgi:hypothetical protein